MSYRDTIREMIETCRAEPVAAIGTALAFLFAIAMIGRGSLY